MAIRSPKPSISGHQTTLPTTRSLDSEAPGGEVPRPIQSLQTSQDKGAILGTVQSRALGHLLTRGRLKSTLRGSVLHVLITRQVYVLHRKVNIPQAEAPSGSHTGFTHEHRSRRFGVRCSFTFCFLTRCQTCSSSPPHQHHVSSPFQRAMVFGRVPHGGRWTTHRPHPTPGACCEKLGTAACFVEYKKSSSSPGRSGTAAPGSSPLCTSRSRVRRPLFNAKTERGESPPKKKHTWPRDKGKKLRGGTREKSLPAPTQLESVPPDYSVSIPPALRSVSLQTSGLEWVPIYPTRTRKSRPNPKNRSKPITLF